MHVVTVVDLCIYFNLKSLSHLQDIFSFKIILQEGEFPTEIPSMGTLFFKKDWISLLLCSVTIDAFSFKQD